MTLEDHLGCLPRRSSGAMGGFGRLGTTKGDRGRRICSKKRPAPRFLEVTHLRVLSDLFKGLVTSIWGINPESLGISLGSLCFLLRSCPLQFLFRLPLVFEYILKFVGGIAR